MDVFDWLAEPGRHALGYRLRQSVHPSLFGERAAPLLAGIAARCRVFLCCEPRRAALPLAASHLIGLLGAGPVTRQDAVASVHAGFRAHELSDLWPDPRRLGLARVSGGPVQPLLPRRPDKDVRESDANRLRRDHRRRRPVRRHCRRAAGAGGMAGRRRREGALSAAQGVRGIHLRNDMAVAAAIGRRRRRCWKSPDRACAASASTPATRW